MKGHRFMDRLGFAWAGLCAAWRLEKSMKTHTLAVCVVAALLWFTRSPAIWWAVMALTVALVLATELLNTAIEALADHLHPQRHEAIKLTKDMAAAAVLVASILALVVGAAFFVDQVWPKLAMWLKPLL